MKHVTKGLLVTCLLHHNFENSRQMYKWQMNRNRNYWTCSFSSDTAFWENIFRFSTSSLRLCGMWPCLLQYTHTQFPCGHVTCLVSLHMSDMVVKLPRLSFFFRRGVSLTWSSLILNWLPCVSLYWERRVCHLSVLVNSNHSLLKAATVNWDAHWPPESFTSILINNTVYIALRVCTLVHPSFLLGRPTRNCTQFPTSFIQHVLIFAWRCPYVLQRWKHFLSRFHVSFSFCELYPYLHTTCSLHCRCCRKWKELATIWIMLVRLLLVWHLCHSSLMWQNYSSLLFRSGNGLMNIRKKLHLPRPQMVHQLCLVLSRIHRDPPKSH